MSCVWPPIAKLHADWDHWWFIGYDGRDDHDDGKWGHVASRQEWEHYGANLGNEGITGSGIGKRHSIRTSSDCTLWGLKSRGTNLGCIFR